MKHEFFTYLEREHEAQRSAAKQLKKASSEDDREKQRNILYKELYPHIMAEEETMFKKLQESDDEEAKEHALESLQEHHVAKLILRELMDLKVDSEVFKAKASVLGEMNDHHMEEEEEENFADLKRVLSKDQLDQLLEDFKACREKYFKEIG